MEQQASRMQDGEEVLKDRLGWHLEVPTVLQPLMTVRSVSQNIFPETFSHNQR